MGSRLNACTVVMNKSNVSRAVVNVMLKLILMQRCQENSSSSGWETVATSRKKK
jgi:hypothetical protein